ncbi:MAG: DNA-binding MarR family transcriptional regulator [Planctomycetota bacterium]|jgi:DNA-binding MarR family transcriptional regulator
MSSASKSAIEAAGIIASQCAHRNTRLLNRRITQWYEDALRPIGLRATQLTLLVAVGRLGPIRPADLAPALAMEKSTLSRNTDRLIERGWLEVLADDDARSQLLSLTRSGGQILERALPLWTEAQAKAQATLGVSGMESLGRLARKAHKAN